MNVVILGLNRDQIRRVAEGTQQQLTYEEVCVLYEESVTESS